MAPLHLCALASRTPAAGSREGERRRAPAGERALSDLPEPPELHRSDLPLRGAALPDVRESVLRRRRRYFESPITRWIARAINLVPVDPDSNLVPAMQAGAFGLRHGKVLVLFPEGERSIDGTVKRFKKGAPILARHLGVPVVPVALHGFYEIWPRNRAIDWRRLLPWSGHRVTIEFGEPMRFGEDESYADAALRLRDQVAGCGNKRTRKH